MGKWHLPLKVKFYEQMTVVHSTGCWEWGGRLVKGYGQVWHEGKHYYTHIVAWWLYVGQIPCGLELDHLCRNTICGNPEHLEAVPKKINLLRGDGWAAKNARKTHCKRGHPFDEENTGTRKSGSRYCCTCTRMGKEGRAEWDREHGS